MTVSRRGGAFSGGMKPKIRSRLSPSFSLGGQGEEIVHLAEGGGCMSSQPRGSRRPQPRPRTLSAAASGVFCADSGGLTRSRRHNRRVAARADIEISVPPTTAVWW